MPDNLSFLQCDINKHMKSMTRRVPLVEQELLAFPEHRSSSGDRDALSV